MRARLVAAAITTAFIAGSFAACKDNTVNQTSNTTNNFTSVGPSGGFAVGPDGTRVDVPAGALNETVNMGIVEADAKEGPVLPSTVTPIGKVYAFHPHGQFFLIDATITMPAPNGDIDIYRAEPGGSWALFAKPKASNNLVRFRTSTFSFYVATKGTGGCVRDLDCVSGQTCVSNACVTGGDAGGDGGGDAGSGDAGDDAGTCADPAASGKSSNVTTSDMSPKTSGVATTKSGPDGSDFMQEIRIKFADFPDACAYATEDRMKANTKFFLLDLRRKSSTALPPAFTNGTYNFGLTFADAGDLEENISMGAMTVSSDCMGPGGGGGLQTGSITLTAVSVDRVAGSYNVTNDGTGKSFSGTFDVPICNPKSGASWCCVK